MHANTSRYRCAHAAQVHAHAHRNVPMRAMRTDARAQGCARALTRTRAHTQLHSHSRALSRARARAQACTRSRNARVLCNLSAPVSSCAKQTSTIMFGQREIACAPRSEVVVLLRRHRCSVVILTKV
eukprot:6162335-Pleurochrysis_carterae.AAC.1